MASVERTRKRSKNVCVRCQRQKIKCSGSKPCHSCSKRNISCIFNQMERKVLVTRGYISELQQKAACVENQGGSISKLNRQNKFGPADEDTPDNQRFDQFDDNGDSEGAQNPESGLVNSLSTGAPSFMSSANGRMFYLGTSSNWSFTRRVLSIAHQHVYKEVLPTETLIFEGSAYDLSEDESRTDPIPENPILPSLDHALYLIGIVNFRCGQLYHLFEEKDFMRSLHDFYSEDGGSEESLWRIHFFLILAFGKSLIQTKSRERKPPGIKYFAKAMQLLPDHNRLYSSPLISTEILCCIAIFYQSLDCRSPAHNYIGQAMRMAMSHGMHTCMPVGDLGLDVVERCRKIWWTVYILDRQMTSIQGLPQSLDDRFVQTSLPSSSDSIGKTTTLGMQIKLCRRVAEINNTVYGIDGRINQTFLLSTKEALSNIAGLADELRGTFPLHLDGTGNGMSRASAYLHLFYQQCVIVATRPLLFCFLKIRLESPQTCTEFLNKTRNVRNLIQMCVESAQHAVRVLLCLKSEGLLETFLTFDLESIFISAVVLLMGPAIDPLLVDDHSWWLEKAYEIFGEMVEAGNQVAKFRLSELQQLGKTLQEITQAQDISLGSGAVPPNTDSIPQLLSQATSFTPASMDQGSYNDPPLVADTMLDGEYGFGPVLTSAEMTAMADSIEMYDAEWVSNAMMIHDIW